MSSNWALRSGCPLPSRVALLAALLEHQVLAQDDDAVVPPASPGAVGVEGLGQAELLDQQPTGAQATEAAAAHLAGDIAVDVPIREEAATLLRPRPLAETEEVLVVVRERQADGTCKHDYYLSNAAAPGGPGEQALGVEYGAEDGGREGAVGPQRQEAPARPAQRSLETSMPMNRSVAVIGGSILGRGSGVSQPCDAALVGPATVRD
jgi:hypothetical protein